MDFGTPKAASAYQASYIVKVSPAGKHLWTKTIDGQGIFYATSSSSSQGRTVFAGYVKPEIGGSELDLSDFGITPAQTLGDRTSSWVLMLDSQDLLAWPPRVFNTGGATYLTATAISSAGDVFVVGYSNALGDIGCGMPDSGATSGAFVAKLKGTSGECDWYRVFGDPGDGVLGPLSVATGNGNDPVIVGQFSKTFSVLSSQVQKKGGDSDGFMVKLSSDGKSVLWARSVGSLAADDARSVAVDSAGDAWVAGSFGDKIDLGDGTPVPAPASYNAFLVKLNGTDGGHLLHKVFGNVAISAEHGVAVGPNKQIAIGGSLLGDSNLGGGTLKPAGSRDVFAARYDDGAFLYAGRWGDSVAQDAWSIGVFPDGDVALVGPYRGNLSFGSPCSYLQYAGNTGVGFVARVGIP